MVGDSEFPDDENGDVLRRMSADGDDLSAPRNIDFEHVFVSKAGAVAFLAEVASPSQEACLSCYAEQSAWNVRVTRYMNPSHAEISRVEAELAASARKHGGSPDGWGCLEVRQAGPDR